MGQVKGPEGCRTDVEQQQEMTSLNANLPSVQKGSSPHVLTLTPFYPNDRDATNGCFISEPLDWLAKTGVRNTVFAVQPFYRARLRASDSAMKAEWLRYFSLPGGIGLPTAGVFSSGVAGDRMSGFFPGLACFYFEFFFDGRE